MIENDYCFHDNHGDHELVEIGGWELAEALSPPTRSKSISILVSCSTSASSP